MDSPLHPGACIGVFDSGVGGLSVLAALQRRLPQAPLLYLADSGHAPYGERAAGYVLDRSQRIARHLRSEGAIGLVVACNTATAAAVGELRARWHSLPIVGVEPGLKPAVAMTRNRRIGVMATLGTLASERFRALLRGQPSDVTIVPRPCPGLAALIEDGELDAPSLLAAIHEHGAALRAAEVDTVVLGCTHYAFVRHHIAAELGPGVQIVDTAEAVARHAATLMQTAARRPTGEAGVRLQTTGDVARLRRIASAWLPFACSVETVPASSPAHAGARATMIPGTPRGWRNG